MFVVLVMFANFYSDTSQIVRAMFAITLTSCCQVVVLYLGRDTNTAPARRPPAPSVVLT